VNNRLYSFDVKPLHLINIDEYVKMEEYTQEGLPEVRITINHIPPEYIAIFGQQGKHTTRDTILPLNLENDNYRFRQASNSNTLFGQGKGSSL